MSMVVLEVLVVDEIGDVVAVVVVVGVVDVDVPSPHFPDSLV